MTTRSRIWQGALSAFVAVVLASSQVFAQGENGFVLAKPDDIITEKLPATPLVFAAYAVVWVTLVVYVLTLWRRITKAESEIASVAARLEGKR